MKQELEGKRFGKWVVVSYVGKVNSRDIWHCQCDCGAEKNVQQRTLLSGDSTSCGCDRIQRKRMDIEGKKFGKLTVLSFAYVKNTHTYFNCICECGNKCIIMGKSLVSGNTTSCGCINHGKGQIRKNVKGKKFGYLTAESYKGVINGHSIWSCKCECGNIVDVGITTLMSGNTKSCGCKHYPVTDTKELAKLFNKHVTTITFVKRKLFGEGHLVLTSKEKEEMCNYFKTLKKFKGVSKGEKEVVAFVKSIYKGEVIENDRSIIAPKEIDVYIPEKNFAIEYNGLYWHSEGGDCYSDYHLNKTKMCMNKGIRLLHIYENEWRDKQDICKSMIASALGVYERKEFARKCEVREVTDRNTVIDFFEQNHIQGAVHKFSLCLGLYKGDELLQAVVFGKQHFGRNGDVELYRMVTKKNVQVLGGFSKLMKHCPYDTVVSYVALRMFDAKGYLAGNWKIEHTSHPSFCITDGINVYSRHLFKKDKCLKLFDNVTEDMTEREMQIKNGYYRLWDCGTYKVRWCRTA